MTGSPQWLILWRWLLLLVEGLPIRVYCFFLLVHRASWVCRNTGTFISASTKYIVLRKDEKRSSCIIFYEYKHSRSKERSADGNLEEEGGEEKPVGRILCVGKCTWRTALTRGYLCASFVVRLFAEPTRASLESA